MSGFIELIFRSTTSAVVFSLGLILLTSLVAKAWRVRRYVRELQRQGQVSAQSEGAIEARN